MGSDFVVLYITALSVSFIHTILGPDHYLPFIAMSRARQWSLAKTSLITVLCGLGHIMSSIILGIIFGMSVMRLEVLERVRANLAGGALIGFGFMYFVWGLHKMLKNKPHMHFHTHMDCTGHSHSHPHTREHAHIHDIEGKANIIPWILFTIFVLGPCEPLIPLLIYPAAKHNIIGIIGIAGVFGAVTIITMCGIVIVSSLGINLIPLNRLERYTHVLAGAIICICGLAIRFLGL